MSSSRLSQRSRRALVLILLLTLTFSAACNMEPQPRLESVVVHGTTMGTTYMVRYHASEIGTSQQRLKEAIDNELELVNLQMSTYRNDSEVSRFNSYQSAEWFPVSHETAYVVDLALKIATISDGAFDVTVGPLVDLWGFGPEGRHDMLPSNAQLEEALKQVGYQNLQVRDDPPALRKSVPSLRIDLSAIAKGHGADRVSDLLKRYGAQNSFVEIGGEIVTRGHRSGTESWKIGIESPLDFKRTIEKVVELSDAALATSGDYRNFFIDSNSRFSHTIDPKTGRPVTHSLASASVIAENAALADAIATCMMVLGNQDGLRIAEENGWAVLLMQRAESGIESNCSNPWRKRSRDPLGEVP